MGNDFSRHNIWRDELTYLILTAKDQDFAPLTDNLVKSGRSIVGFYDPTAAVTPETPQHVVALGKLQNAVNIKTHSRDSFKFLLPLIAAVSREPHLNLIIYMLRHGCTVNSYGYHLSQQLYSKNRENNHPNGGVFYKSKFLAPLIAPPHTIATPWKLIPPPVHDAKKISKLLGWVGATNILEKLQNSKFKEVLAVNPMVATFSKFPRSRAILTQFQHSEPSHDQLYNNSLLRQPHAQQAKVREQWNNHILALFLSSGVDLWSTPLLPSNDVLDMLPLDPRTTKSLSKAKSTAGPLGSAITIGLLEDNGSNSRGNGPSSPVPRGGMETSSPLDNYSTISYTPDCDNEPIDTPFGPEYDDEPKHQPNYQFLGAFSESNLFLIQIYKDYCLTENNAHVNILSALLRHPSSAFVEALCAGKNSIAGGKIAKYNPILAKNDFITKMDFSAASKIDHILWYILDNVHPDPFDGAEVMPDEDLLKEGFGMQKGNSFLRKNEKRDGKNDKNLPQNELIEKLSIFEQNLSYIILNSKVDFNILNHNGCTLLHHAILRQLSPYLVLLIYKKSCEHYSKFLIRDSPQYLKDNHYHIPGTPYKPPDYHIVNHQDHFGRTPLMLLVSSPIFLNRYRAIILDMLSEPLLDPTLVDYSLNFQSWVLLQQYQDEAYFEAQRRLKLEDPYFSEKGEILRAAFSPAFYDMVYDKLSHQWHEEAEAQLLYEGILHLEGKEKKNITAAGKMGMASSSYDPNEPSDEGLEAEGEGGSMPPSSPRSTSIQLNSKQLVPQTKFTMPPFIKVINYNSFALPLPRTLGAPSVPLMGGLRSPAGTTKIHSTIIRLILPAKVNAPASDQLHTSQDQLSFLRAHSRSTRYLFDPNSPTNSSGNNKAVLSPPQTSLSTATVLFSPQTSSPILPLPTASLSSSEVHLQTNNTSANSLSLSSPMIPNTHSNDAMLYQSRNGPNGQNNASNGQKLKIFGLEPDPLQPDSDFADSQYFKDFNPSLIKDKSSPLLPPASLSSNRGSFITNNDDNSPRSSSEPFSTKSGSDRTLSGKYDRFPSERHRFEESSAHGGSERELLSNLSGNYPSLPKLSPPNSPPSSVNSSIYTASLVSGGASTASSSKIAVRTQGPPNGSGNGLSVKVDQSKFLQFQLKKIDFLTPPLDSPDSPRSDDGADDFNPIVNPMSEKTRRAKRLTQFDDCLSPTTARASQQPYTNNNITNSNNNQGNLPFVTNSNTNSNSNNPHLSSSSKPTPIITINANGPQGRAPLSPKGNMAFLAPLSPIRSSASSASSSSSTIPSSPLNSSSSLQQSASSSLLYGGKGERCLGRGPQGLAPLSPKRLSSIPLPDIHAPRAPQSSNELDDDTEGYGDDFTHHNYQNNHQNGHYNRGGISGNDVFNRVADNDPETDNISSDNSSLSLSNDLQPSFAHLFPTLLSPGTDDLNDLMISQSNADISLLTKKQHLLEEQFKDVIVDRETLRSNAQLTMAQSLHLQTSQLDHTALLNRSSFLNEEDSDGSSVGLDGKKNQGNEENNPGTHGTHGLNPVTNIMLRSPRRMTARGSIDSRHLSLLQPQTGADPTSNRPLQGSLGLEPAVSDHQTRSQVFSRGNKHLLTGGPKATSDSTSSSLHPSLSSIQSQSSSGLQASASFLAGGASQMTAIGLHNHSNGKAQVIAQGPHKPHSQSAFVSTAFANTNSKPRHSYSNTEGDTSDDDFLVHGADGQPLQSSKDFFTQQKNRKISHSLSISRTNTDEAVSSESPSMTGGIGKEKKLSAGGNLPPLVVAKGVFEGYNSPRSPNNNNNINQNNNNNNSPINLNQNNNFPNNQNIDPRLPSGLKSTLSLMPPAPDSSEDDIFSPLPTSPQQLTSPKPLIPRRPAVVKAIEVPVAIGKKNDVGGGGIEVKKVSSPTSLIVSPLLQNHSSNSQRASISDKRLSISLHNTLGPRHENQDEFDFLDVFLPRTIACAKKSIGKFNNGTLFHYFFRSQIDYILCPEANHNKVKTADFTTNQQTYQDKRRVELFTHDSLDHQLFVAFQKLFFSSYLAINGQNSLPGVVLDKLDIDPTRSLRNGAKRSPMLGANNQQRPMSSSGGNGNGLLSPNTNNNNVPSPLSPSPQAPLAGPSSPSQSQPNPVFRRGSQLMGGQLAQAARERENAPDTVPFYKLKDFYGFTVEEYWSLYLGNSIYHPNYE